MSAKSDPESHVSDPALVAACLAGDATAWERLVDQYGRLVYSVARSTGLGDSDCDDVFQNVFLVLYRRLETLQDHRRLSAWLITTTRRECWRLGRRQRPDAALEEHLADPRADVACDAERAEEKELVHVALDRLGGRPQTLLTALYDPNASPSYQHVADRVGVAVGSIGPTRARSFVKLAEILEGLGLVRVDRLAAAAG